jgi:hypothetical protein
LVKACWRRSLHDCLSCNLWPLRLGYRCSRHPPTWISVFLITLLYLKQSIFSYCLSALFIYVLQLRGREFWLFGTRGIHKWVPVTVGESSFFLQSPLNQLLICVFEYRLNELNFAYLCFNPFTLFVQDTKAGAVQSSSVLFVYASCDMLQGSWSSW